MKIRIRTGDQKCYSLRKYIAKTGRILLGLVRVTDTVDLVQQVRRTHALIY